MKHNHSNHGITLTEILVTVAIIAVLLAVSIPAAKELSRSLEQSVGAGSVIDAALANARAIAIREQKYAGVRFQRDVQGNSYLTFIIHDPAATGIANGFRAVENKKPMALPEAVGVISCRVQENYADDAITDVDLFMNGKANPTASDSYLNSDVRMNDASTFSIIFNASGKFVFHNVRVRSSSTNDKIFNTAVEGAAGRAMFRRDES
jgi:prepilin-type N-terminal cleavage/methylation domain-containing protein